LGGGPTARFWHPIIGVSFFAAQMWMHHLWRGETRGERPRSIPPAGTCPFYWARPLAAVLRGEGDGGQRYLLCSLCSTEWESRRILCASCGEEHNDDLPVFIAPEFDYIRLGACDSCKSYLKCIDLTRNGLAIAPADEIASVALNVWPEEHGYAQIEPNLLGL
jgi:FdhE protein